MKLITFFVSFYCSLFNCNSNSNSNKNIASEPMPPQIESKTIISFTQYKGRCSTCPYFSLEVLDNQQVKYNGKQNMAVLGEKTFAIADSTYKELTQKFAASKFTDFEPKYMSRIRDLPIAKVIYQEYAVKYQDKVCPETLQPLVKLIKDLVPKE